MNSILRSEPPAAPAQATAPAAAGPAELVVEHETVYAYGSAVDLAHHIAMLKPRGDGVQELLDFALRIDPAPARVLERVDAWGNALGHFSLTVPHESLSVQATSRVRVMPSPPLPPAMSWEAAREHWRYQAGRPLDAAVEFAYDSGLVERAAALRIWAAPSFAAGRPLDEAARELMHRLHEEFTYEPDSTEVDTPMLEAFAQKRGVCQDFAHVMIGALRSLGLAARYVSGYLLTDPPPGQPRLQGADASHAWVAVALPRADGSGSDWLELDPTNDCGAGTGHVRVAYGRDYRDVTPLSGVIRGGGRHTLTVRVSTHPA